MPPPKDPTKYKEYCEKLSIVHTLKPNRYWLGKKRSDETCLKISLANKGKKLSEETKNKMSLSRMGEKNHFYGKKHSKETLEKISEKNGNAWRGGVTPLYKKIRKSLKYKEWRKSIFERDDYTCTWCKERGVELHADHIKSFALYPELRFELSNGRTLCVDCHKKTDTYGGNSITNKLVNNKLTNV